MPKPPLIIKDNKRIIATSSAKDEREYTLHVRTYKQSSYCDCWLEAKEGLVHYSLLRGTVPLRLVRHLAKVIGLAVVETKHEQARPVYEQF